MIHKGIEKQEETKQETAEEWKQVQQEQPCSYAWRGTRGVGKRTQLLDFLKVQAHKSGYNFQIKLGTWYLNKQSPAGGDPDEDDEEGTGKSIPFEESPIHLGFDVARMSMSDKVFLQSILTRWTGQNDVCLMGSNIKTRYLVLYHAHFLTDESVLQLQECLEQYPTFAILLTTELPVCSRLRDFCMEIPVTTSIEQSDLLLDIYTKEKGLPQKDVWLEFFKKTINDWSSSWDIQKVADIRNWIYICLQRNLRWTDVIMYWIEAIYETEWITPNVRHKLLDILWEAESSAGWVLLTSYRIPILWEHVHLKLAKTMYENRTGAIPFIPVNTPKKIKVLNNILEQSKLEVKPIKEKPIKEKPIKEKPIKIKEKKNNSLSSSDTIKKNKKEAKEEKEEKGAKGANTI
jgi:hypothetical protein